MSVQYEMSVKAGETGPASVAVAGDADASNADEVRLAILDAAAKAGVTLEVNLSEVTFIDSAGLRAIADTAQELEALGSGFVLRDVPEQVLRLVVISGIWANLDVI
jgi:anti-anti-sigma factor